MVINEFSSHCQCGLLADEYNTITLELERIDALAEMAFPEDGETTIQPALLLIQERTEKIGALLTAGNDRTSAASREEGAAHG